MYIYGGGDAETEGVRFGGSGRVNVEERERRDESYLKRREECGKGGKIIAQSYVTKKHIT